MKTQVCRICATKWAPAILGAALALVVVRPLPLAAKSLTAGIAAGKTTQGYGYVSGGVGIEERNRSQGSA